MKKWNPTMNTIQNTFSTRQAAEHLGLSKSYLDKLRCYEPKHSPPFARIGTRIVYPVALLDKWLEEKTSNGVRKS
jgi:predicted DNA-binding transcriptional regulator AlpA